MRKRLRSRHRPASRRQCRRRRISIRPLHEHNSRQRRRLRHRLLIEPLLIRLNLRKQILIGARSATKLSDQCAGEIMSKRVSRNCEAEGQAWSEGLKEVTTHSAEKWMALFRVAGLILITGQVLPRGARG